MDQGSGSLGSKEHFVSMDKSQKVSTFPCVVSPNSTLTILRMIGVSILDGSSRLWRAYSEPIRIVRSSVRSVSFSLHRISFSLPLSSPCRIRFCRVIGVRIALSWMGKGFAV